MYFASADHVHAFANGPVHRDGWTWWNKIAATHRHLMIFHELYHVPRGYWETVYAHAEPTGLAATMHRVEVEGEKGMGKEVWMSPVVGAEKGVLKNSAGRMGRNLSEKV